MNSRLTIVLHPNPSRVDVVLNDRMFNRERYSFSRKQEPKGDEAVLLSVLNDCVIGIEKAETSKNTLSLELADCMLHAEWVPAVVLAVKQFGGAPDYDPVIFCDDRRWASDPVYNDDGYGSGGVQMRKGAVDLGVNYQPWQE